MPALALRKSPSSASSKRNDEIRSKDTADSYTDCKNSRHLLQWLSSMYGIVGAPVGVYAVRTLDPHALRIGIAVLVLALTVIVIANRKWRVPKPQVTGPVIGFCASAMVRGLAIGGPLLVLFLLGRGMDRQGGRASMAFLFTVMYCTALACYAFQGLVTADRLQLTAATILAVALGFWLSVRLTGKMNARVFRQAVVIVIAATSILVLAREALTF